MSDHALVVLLSQAFYVRAGTQECTQNLSITAPTLWSVDTPYLYRAVTRLIVDGTVVDEYPTIFGVRTIAFDKEKGFLLNGERVKINGVCLHHDGGSVGADERLISITQVSPL